MNKFAIPALAVAFALAGVSGAAATDKDKRNKRDRSESSAAAAGVGVAGASRDGAVAGGIAASEARSMNQGRAARNGTMTTPNAAQTNSSGAVFTDRRTAAAGVNSNGSAAGTGRQQTGSTVEAFGETTRDGSNADIYGDSTATSGTNN